MQYILMYRDGHTSYTMRSCCIDPDRAHKQCSPHQENSEVQLRFPEITHHSVHHRQFSFTTPPVLSTVLIYITLQHICTSGYNSTFMVRSITRLSSSGIVSNLPDCVVCHGARVIIGCANVSQIDDNIITLMTVMVTPCCS